MKAYRATYTITMLCRTLDVPRAATTHGASASHRRVLSWAMANHLGTERILEALDTVIYRRNRKT